jgi:hypothetical protein
MADSNFDNLVAKSIRVGSVAGAEVALQPNALSTLSGFIAGAQTTGVKKMAFIAPYAGVITDIRAYLDTAPTGANFIIDVNKNGTTVFTTQGNRPTIAAAANASSTTAPDVTAVAAGDRITVDIDQIGSGTAGSDLYVSVTMKRANVA